MKRTFVHITICCAAFLLTLGCSHTSTFQPYIEPVADIQILAGMDTLRWISPEDTICFPVTILVMDAHGNGLPARRVSATLADTTQGILEFSDPVLRDTTDISGRVELRCCLYLPYFATIYAECEGVRDSFITMPRPAG